MTDAPDALDTFFQDYRRSIEGLFREYRNSGFSDSFNLNLPFPEDVSSKLDVGTILRPIATECNRLVYDRLLTEEQKKLLADGLWNIDRQIGRKFFGDHGDNPKYFRNWLDLQIMLLKPPDPSVKHNLAINSWLRCCYNLTDPGIKHFFTLFEVNRDAEMRRLVFDEAGRVREFFVSEATPGRLYKPALSDWFRHRYDLVAASVLKKASATDRDRQRPVAAIRRGLGGAPSWGWWLTLGLSVAMIVLLVLAAGQWLPAYWPSWMQSVEGLFSLGTPSLPAGSSIVVWQILTYQGMTVLVLALMLFFPVLPRLLGGILIGYVPMITGAEAWEWLVRMPTVTAIVVCATLLLASFLYLHFEAHKVVVEGPLDAAMKRELAIRVSYVFWIGLIYSLFIGIVVCELFAATAVTSQFEAIADIELVALAGWMGFVIPKLVLLYAPFALFLGILIQLIWEEETATQSL